jgi:hypothetical protein
MICDRGSERKGVSEYKRKREWGFENKNIGEMIRPNNA